MGPNDVRAYEALVGHAKLGDLVALARDVLGGAARARKAEWADAARVKSKAEELKLTLEDCATPFGNALAVLERGPEDDAERGLAAALWAHVLAESPPKSSEDEDSAVADLLWLATRTPFDATGLVDRALGDAADEVWATIADRIRRIDEGELAPLGRGEALAACSALVASSSTAAGKQAGALANELKDRAFARVLASRKPPPTASADEKLTGEMLSAPRGPITTALLALTGVLLALHAARLLGKVALAYKRPAEITLGEDGVRIKTHTELLGRVLRERDIVIARTGLARATREVRYPRTGLYAGLLALAIGSYLGIATLVDGVRSASPSLLLTGLLIVAAGIGLDFALASLAPGMTGHVRIAFVPRAGSAVCVGGLDAKRADAALRKLAHAR
jgi:hypothetical protein